ncbi:MAG: cofactor-independent phosphoglycerate mutase [Ruminococcaceae bacterium]|nr:cofactor-independent phosphoglycerate mutase [Oscillospiraceae bacterium]
MKYFVMLGDGMADYKIDSLGNRTPLQAADKPVMDYLASHGCCGKVKTVPDSLVPESDTANLSVMGYDPEIYSKGRSPLEAASIGLEMSPDDYAIRCNVVTLSEDGKYEDKIIIDHSADEISTEEADLLIKAVDEALGTEDIRFHTGISYRHCLLWKNPPGYDKDERLYDFTRPHDILDKRIGEYLPSGEIGKFYRELMEKSYDILNDHPVNRKRREMGKRPANSVWLWSPGKKPRLSSFADRFKLKSTVVSAVDLIKGIGICAGFDSIDVEGATGNVHTNFPGKAQAAIDAFKNGSDFVYVHVEAPDECGHRGETENKVKSIELIDSLILAPVKSYLDSTGEDYKILLLPDHPTPIVRRTHTREPVPFVIFDSRNLTPNSSAKTYDEDSCDLSGVYVEPGYTLIDRFIE